MFSGVTCKIFPRPGKFKASRRAERDGRPALFFMNLCFACCALLFYFLFLLEGEQKNLENKKTINIYIYIHVYIRICVYTIFRFMLLDTYNIFHLFPSFFPHIFSYFNFHTFTICW